MACFWCSASSLSFPSSRTPQTHPRGCVCGVRRVPAPLPDVSNTKICPEWHVLMFGAFPPLPLISNATNTPTRACLWCTTRPLPLPLRLEHQNTPLVYDASPPISLVPNTKTCPKGACFGVQCVPPHLRHHKHTLVGMFMVSSMFPRPPTPYPVFPFVQNTRNTRFLVFRMSHPPYSLQIPEMCLCGQVFWCSAPTRPTHSLRHPLPPRHEEHDPRVAFFTSGLSLHPSLHLLPPRHKERDYVVAFFMSGVFPHSPVIPLTQTQGTQPSGCIPCVWGVSLLLP